MIHAEDGQEAALSRYLRVSGLKTTTISLQSFSVMEDAEPDDLHNSVCKLSPKHPWLLYG